VRTSLGRSLLLHDYADVSGLVVLEQESVEISKKILAKESPAKIFVSVIETKKVLFEGND